MATNTVDVLLVGAGAMSSTLGVMLNELDPSLSIIMAERLERVSQESTDAMNNAGTGHAAYCELNYTPQDADGSIDTESALSINAAFEVSLQFWSYLVNKGSLPAPENFITNVPHHSFVWGEENVAFLRKRHEVMSALPQFAEMEYTEDRETLREWMPLIMAERSDDEPVAGTRVKHGTDVDFGTLARSMVRSLKPKDNFELRLGRSVSNLKRLKNGNWKVTLKNHPDNTTEVIEAGFVFLGAGGGALPLLQKSGIPEGKGYGGFPVSGQWLVCNNQEIVEQHMAKVYGQAPVGAPPMSVPHMDSRVINGKRALLFGPFAGFTTKFLKEGSILDMPKSLRLSNMRPLMSAGARNMDLTRYLIKEVMQSHSDRIEALRAYFPGAQADDWELLPAGQRVQVIKKDETGKGVLAFGTEVINSADGSLAALLGASPGASIAPPTMLDVIQRCFPERTASAEWQEKLREMVPSMAEELMDDPARLKETRAYTLSTLKITQN